MPLPTDRIIALLNTYNALKSQEVILGTQIAGIKDSIEAVFAAEGATDMLKEGVKITTPHGIIPIKVVQGTTTKVDKKKLMMLFKLTPGDLEKASTTVAKKAYLSISWPKDKEDL